MPHPIAGEDIILSPDFTRETGQAVLMDSGSMDVMFRLLRGPCTLRVVLVAQQDLRKITIEEVVLGNSLPEVLRVITSIRFSHLLAAAFDSRVDRIRSFLRLRIVPLIERLIRQPEPIEELVLGREAHEYPTLQLRRVDIEGPDLVQSGEFQRVG